MSGARRNLSQVETLGLLRSREFRKVDQYFSAVQTSFDKGFITDEELRAAFRAFYATDADLEAQYGSGLQCSRDPDSVGVENLKRALALYGGSAPAHP